MFEYANTVVGVKRKQHVSVESRATDKLHVKENKSAMGARRTTSLGLLRRDGAAAEAAAPEHLNRDRLATLATTQIP